MFFSAAISAWSDYLSSAASYRYPSVMPRRQKGVINRKDVPDFTPRFINRTRQKRLPPIWEAARCMLFYFFFVLEGASCFWSQFLPSTKRETMNDTT